MDKLKLKAKKREIVGKKVRAMRREGLVPAVMYGRGKESQALVIEKKEFDRVYREVGGSSIVILDVEGGSPKNVLIKEVDREPLNDQVLHADFYQVRMDEKITATIPLVFVGDSKAVLDLSGSLITNKSEVEVECLPGDLPHEIEVDISQLEDFESVIHVSDLKVASGVEVKDDPEESIAFVEEPRSEEEMAELEEPVEEVVMPEAEAGEAPEASETEEPQPQE